MSSNDGRPPWMSPPPAQARRKSRGSSRRLSGGSSAVQPIIDHSGAVNVHRRPSTGNQAQGSTPAGSTEPPAVEDITSLHHCAPGPKPAELDVLDLTKTPLSTHVNVRRKSDRTLTLPPLDRAASARVELTEVQSLRSDGPSSFSGNCNHGDSETEALEDQRAVALASMARLSISAPCSELQVVDSLTPLAKCAKNLKPSKLVIPPRHGRTYQPSSSRYVKEASLNVDDRIDVASRMVVQTPVDPNARFFSSVTPPGLQGSGDLSLGSQCSNANSSSADHCVSKAPSTNMSVEDEVGVGSTGRHAYNTQPEKLPAAGWSALFDGTIPIPHLAKAIVYISVIQALLSGGLIALLTFEGKSIEEGSFGIGAGGASILAALLGFTARKFVTPVEASKQQKQWSTGRWQLRLFSTFQSLSLIFWTLFISTGTTEDLPSEWVCKRHLASLLRKAQEDCPMTDGLLLIEMIVGIAQIGIVGVGLSFGLWLLRRLQVKNDQQMGIAISVFQRHGLITTASSQDNDPLAVDLGSTKSDRRKSHKINPIGRSLTLKANTQLQLLLIGVLQLIANGVALSLTGGRYAAASYMAFGSSTILALSLCTAVIMRAKAHPFGMFFVAEAWSLAVIGGFLLMDIRAAASDEELCNVHDSQFRNGIIATPPPSWCTDSSSTSARTIRQAAAMLAGLTALAAQGSLSLVSRFQELSVLHRAMKQVGRTKA